MCIVTKGMQNKEYKQIPTFTDYFINKEWNVIRIQKVTKHHHYKSEIVIKCNSRNQYVLFRNGAKNYISKRQIKILFKNEI